MAGEDQVERVARAIATVIANDYRMGDDYPDVILENCKRYARAAIAAISPEPSKTARELLARAFEDAGVTGYARHILAGRVEWPWLAPALRAIERALAPQQRVIEALEPLSQLLKAVDDARHISIPGDPAYAMQQAQLDAATERFESAAVAYVRAALAAAEQGGE